ncbi:mitochondrial mRNA pseudouridine synthase RPUSD3-like [Physella acuta]|uniref:mitochondrial mRNA pseudouridine synthase RPUSD3-like n=1 Tax=Physella acuta TaxID=109671 RepID=UPI0027DD98AF|nr:mitochondrial mRNA pseudouridine synthase RPUSD3-like [Physella acuta]
MQCLKCLSQRSSKYSNSFSRILIFSSSNQNQNDKKLRILSPYLHLRQTDIASCTRSISSSKVLSTSGSAEPSNTHKKEHDGSLPGRISIRNKMDKQTKENFDKKVVEVAEELKKCVTFVNRDLLVINKKHGVSVYGKISEHIDSSSKTEASSVVECLPYLKKIYNSPELDVGLSIKSFYTGVLLLTRSSDSKTKLAKVLASVATQQIQFMKYLVITVGVPQCPHATPLEAFIKRKYLHARELSIVNSKDVHMARKNGMMIHTNYTVKPLVVNTELGVALVEVSVDKDKWESVEVLMSHHLSPVLGDHVYSRRAYSLMGVTLAANPYSTPPAIQKLPKALEECLRSKGHMTDGKQMPLFMHRHKVTLSKFKRDSSLVIQAKPDGEFLQVLQSLNLYDPNVFT